MANEHNIHVLTLAPIFLHLNHLLLGHLRRGLALRELSIFHLLILGRDHCIVHIPAVSRIGF